MQLAVSRRRVWQSCSQSPCAPYAPLARSKSTLGAINDGLRRTGSRTTSKPRAPDTTRPDALTKKSTRTGQSRTFERPTNEWIPVPYTTATSEWIYGANAVLAALRARRRTPHKLFVLRPKAGNDDGTRDLNSVLTACRDLAIQPTFVSANFVPVMNKISQGRPHNGIVLEASPLPFPQITGLDACPHTSSPVVALGTESQEAESHARDHNRYPLVLFLDGITDPGNLGNIFRTALFYDVDAVAIVSDTCAPIGNPVVVKASSGAIEALSIYDVRRPADFVRVSAARAWHVLAAVAPCEYTRDRKSRLQTRYLTSTMTNPLAVKPCVLMLGSEGKGLGYELINQATASISVAGPRRHGTTRHKAQDIGLDSLNVGAAAAALLEALTRQPQNHRPTDV